MTLDEARRKRPDSLLIAADIRNQPRPRDSAGRRTRAVLRSSVRVRPLLQRLPPTSVPVYVQTRKKTSNEPKNGLARWFTVLRNPSITGIADLWAQTL
jgi:hypothetical protein